MIRYDLKCANSHMFDSWFQSAAAFDRLMIGGHVTCPYCGSNSVEKALMAPSISRAPQAVPAAEAPVAAHPLSMPSSRREAALAALRREIEAKSEYVGLSFVSEARAIHQGLAPERPIYGEAKLDEARKLVEDGVPVAPLPFMPPRRVN